MRILVAAGIIHPDIGGPATHLFHLLPALQANGHEVRAIAIGREPDPAAVAMTCPVTRVSPGPLALRLVRYSAVYRTDARWADVVYVTSFGLARFGAPPAPTVLRVPGDYAWERAVNRGLVAPTEDVERFQQARHGLRVAALKRARTREVRRADRVIVPSRYLEGLVTGWGVQPRRVRVVRSAVPSTWADASLTRERAREALGWDRDASYVMTAARLTAWKGVDALIEVVARTPAVTLVVAGDGPERAALARQAAPLGDRVRFTGSLSSERLRLHLRASDYLALYSGYEGLSHTLLEALAAGTPVIASNRGGNPEVVLNGQNGLLVDHPDPDALASAFRQAFEPATRRRLAENARAGLDRFSWEETVRRTIDTLESAARREPVPAEHSCES